MALPINKQPVVLRARDSAYAAARALRENNIGCVLVADDRGKLAGIVTDRDLVVRALCDGLDPFAVELRSVMTPGPAAIRYDQGLDDALWLLQVLGVRRVPVVNYEG